VLRVAVGRIPDAPDAGDAVAPIWFGRAEQRRWTRLSPVSRGEFVASRALLRELLQAATGVPAERWDVSAEAGMAPLARADSAAVPATAPHVSLSHRLGWVAAAVACVRVGVDVECDHPMRSDPAERAALMLAASELPAWQLLAVDERESDLFTRWTAKEAWFKASPPDTAPWDFRHVVARACGPAQANVRTWRSPPLHVAVCCTDAQALAGAVCEGVPPAAAAGSYWHVARA
jgi:4'-phosphopantetheinyl transferase EntD